MEENRNNQEIKAETAAETETEKAAREPGSDSRGEASYAAPPQAQAGIRKTGIRKIVIPASCVILALVVATGVLSWQVVESNKRMNTLYSFLSAQNGKDIATMAEKGLELNKHPEYDDSAVVAAYKSGDDSKLSDKDKYVYETASAALREIISDGMSDYDKEKAAYDWLFAHTHYNDQNFVDVGSGNSGSQSESGMTENSGNMPDPAAGDEIARQDPYQENYDYEPYGVLKYKSAICVGNATTLRLFLDMLDIPCRIIHSTDEGEHAWDLVQLDGDWYHCDLTFDGGNTTPSYAAFNVTDNVKMSTGYPWDTTKFPAATATKYCYMLNNAVKVADIYEVPAAVRKAVDKGMSTITVIGKEQGSLTAGGLDSVMSQIGAYYPQGSFYEQEVALSEDETCYVLTTQTSVDYENDGMSEEQDNTDYDRLGNAVEASFGALG